LLSSKVNLYSLTSARYSPKTTITMRFLLFSLYIGGGIPLISSFTPAFLNTGRLTYTSTLPFNTNVELQAGKSSDNESFATIFTASVFLASSLTVSPASSIAAEATQAKPSSKANSAKTTTKAVVDPVAAQREAIKGYRAYLISTSKSLSSADKAEISAKVKAERSKQDVIVGEKKVKTAKTLLTDATDKYNKLKKNKKSDKVAVLSAKDNVAVATEKLKAEEASLKNLRSASSAADKAYSNAQSVVVNTRKAEVKAKASLVESEQKLIEVQKKVAKDKQLASQQKAKAQKAAAEAQSKKNAEASKAKIAAVKQKAAQREKEVLRLKADKQAKAKAEKDARVKARIDEQKRIEQNKIDEKKRIEQEKRAKELAKELAKKQAAEKAKTVSKLKSTIKELEKKKSGLEKKNDKRGLVNVNRELDLQKKELNRLDPPKPKD